MTNKKDVERTTKFEQYETEVEHLKSEILHLTSSVRIKQIDLEEIKAENKIVLDDMKGSFKQIENENICLKKCVEKTYKLDKLNERNDDLANKCKYLEIKIEEQFKCGVCALQSYKKY